MSEQQTRESPKAESLSQVRTNKQLEPSLVSRSYITLPKKEVESRPRWAESMHVENNSDDPLIVCERRGTSLTRGIEDDAIATHLARRLSGLRAMQRMARSRATLTPRRVPRQSDVRCGRVPRHRGVGQFHELRI